MLEIALAGYRIKEKIYEKPRTVAYRGIRISDGAAVVLKTVPGEFPDFTHTAALQHEYQLLQQLNLKNVIKAYDIVKYRNKLFLVLEDAGQFTLKQFLAGKPLSVDDFFLLALQMVDTVEELHQQHIIHKDINPNNIIINPENFHVKIVDFNIASALESETQEITNPKQLEGTIAYMSPEQTGRMNRNIDYRTDFYSLGITFFEMLTGELPFKSDDLLELVYSHLASTPPLASSINQQAPPALAAIISKMLAKMPEERYFSTQGIKHDLLKAQVQWQETHKILPFMLGQEDYQEGLIISPKLYGREEQIKLLLGAYEKVVNEKSQIVLLSGYSGIGKTSLVNEIHKSIIKQKANFIVGKFDELQRGVPFTGVINAFAELIKQVLAESEEKLQAIREELANALGGSGQVIVDFIPDAELVIGNQPPINKLFSVDALNRFTIIMQSFVEVFAKKEHPLVIFLDDLQWADTASLKLIELLLSKIPQHLMIIGAYRDNEVGAEHPLRETINTLTKAQVNINLIKLGPLQIQDIIHLLVDTLHVSEKNIMPLGQLVKEKTGGNPFFVNQFLKQLYKQNLLNYSQSANTWQWEIDQIRQAAFTDNIIDFIASNVKQLSPEVQQTLKLASCIGTKFDLHLLNIISGNDKKAAENLWQAIKANFIIPIGESYKQAELLYNENVIVTNLEKISYQFIHDRVQQAVYSLIDEELRQKIHLKVGRILLIEKPLSEDDKRLFDILNHFNSSITLINDPAEKHEIARYNFWAGKKAKSATAFQAALGYLKAGISLLGTQAWQTDYELTLALNLEIAECNYALGQVTETLQFFDELMQKVHTNWDRAKIYALKAVLYTNFNQYDEAVAAGLAGLKLLGIRLSKEPSKAKLLIYLLRIGWKIGRRKIEDLDKDLKPTTDPLMIFINHLMINAAIPAYVVDAHLHALIGFKMTLLSLEHGNAPHTSIGLLSYAAGLINGFGQYDKAMAVADLAARLEKQTQNSLTVSVNHFLAALIINHWRHPIASTLDELKIANQASIEAGQILFILYIKIITATTMNQIGKPLSEVHKLIEPAPEFAKKLQAINDYNCALMLLHANECLQGIIDPYAKESEKLRNDLRAAKLPTVYMREIYAIEIELLFIMGDYKRSYQLNVEALKIHDTTFENTLLWIENYTYDALNFANGVRMTTSKVEKLRCWRILWRSRRSLKIWSKQNPDNFEHKYFLVCAEIERLKNNILGAVKFFDMAIESARKNDYTKFFAIASECAARFYLRINWHGTAKYHLQQARFAYSKWGAAAKVKELEMKFPDYFTVEKSGFLLRDATITETRTSSTVALDFLSVFKAAQTISSEIILDNLLKKLMIIMTQNAGAQRGLLMVNTGGNFIIEAEVHSGKTAVILPHQPLNDRQDIARVIVNYVIHSHDSVVVGNANQMIDYRNDDYIQKMQIKSVLCMPILRHNQVAAILYLENNETTFAFTEEHLRVLKLLSSQAAISLENARLYAAGKRFVPYEFLAQLHKTSLAEVVLGDQVQKNLSVMFCDIRDFTRLSEKLSPSETYSFINEFLSYMAPIIHQYNGFIDKYIGDAIMALFTKGPEDALQASINIFTALEQFNQVREGANKPPISIGVGLNTGELMLGIIGTGEHLEGSVIGDVVNMASRIERLTRIYNVKILISEHTKNHLLRIRDYDLRLIDERVLRGKSSPVGIWEVFNVDPPQQRDIKRNTLSLFYAAREAFQREDYQNALLQFKQCLNKNPNDTVVQYYIRRCEKYNSML